MRLYNRFKYAFMGLRWLMQKDTHFIVHLVFGVLAVILGMIVGLDRTGWLFIVSAVFLVLIAEAFNTAVEAAVDLSTDTIHPMAKAAKDAGAAGVLLSAAYAVIIGLIIFIPYLI